MNLPQSVKILGAEYLIVYNTLEGSDVDGYTEPSQRLITIDSSLSEAVLMETLYHELVHAILAQSGLSEILTERQEEALATALGAGLSQLNLKWELE